MNISHKVKLLAIFSLAVIIAKILTANNFFFWDTIQLGAKHALFYYNNSLKFDFLPESVDSGHIPFFGYYLAVVWKIFGKTLVASHYAMLPFLIGVVYQLYVLLNKFFEQRNIAFVMILVFVDPTISSQMLLISPDICLIFFLLLTLNATFTNNTIWKIIGSIGLCLISMRGMIVLGSIFIVDLLQIKNNSENWLKHSTQVLKYYMPAGIIASVFFIWHYFDKGWFGFHDDSPWATSFELSSIKQIFFNIIILIWRFIDFGRIFLWLFFVLALIFIVKRKFLGNEKALVFLRYFIAFIAINLPVWIFFKSLAMHRYLLTGFLLFAIIVALIIQEYFQKHRVIYYVALSLLLFSGNFWIYPDKISMGWDATLAHMPYYTLHKKMTNYVDENSISYNQTGSSFPNISESKYTYLADDNEINFVPYNFEKNKFIFQSNIFNDFSDQELDILSQEWELTKEFKKEKYTFDYIKIQIMNKKILITGGAGFIGSHVVRLFVNKYPEYQIFNLDKLTYAGNLENLKDVENASNYNFIKADITNETEINGIFEKEGFDGVIHLAAESHVDRSIANPLEFIQTNIIGTMVLLNAARNYWKDDFEGKLFYHISTDEVYGSLPEEGFFVETTPYDPRSPYSASKASSDHLVRAYLNTYKLPVVISNCSNNYGPNQFPEKLLPLAINNIKNKKPIPIYGKGENIRDWLYVEDHAMAIDTIFHKGVIGETYNIGGNNEWQNIELIKALCSIMDKKLNRNEGESAELITYVTDRAGHDMRYAIDASKLKNELGWEPSVNVEDGLDKTVDWYLGNTDWINNVISGDYEKYYDQQYADR